MPSTVGNRANSRQWDWHCKEQSREHHPCPKALLKLAALTATRAVCRVGWHCTGVLQGHQSSQFSSCGGNLIHGHRSRDCGLHSVTCTYYAGEKNSFSIFKCLGFVLLCAFWGTCGGLWMIRLSVLAWGSGVSRYTPNLCVHPARAAAL